MVEQTAFAVDPSLFVPGLGATLARCESPIERELAIALLMFMGLRRQTINWDSKERPTVDFALRAQHEVDTLDGGYRIDLLVSLRTDRAVYRLAVECDGHEFHEKTKEQAARDKRRERALVAAGYSVLRFTGSEIHRDSGGCAAEIIGLLESAAGIADGQAQKGGR